MDWSTDNLLNIALESLGCDKTKITTNECFTSKNQNSLAKYSALFILDPVSVTFRDYVDFARLAQR